MRFQSQSKICFLIYPYFSVTFVFSSMMLCCLPAGAVVVIVIGDACDDIVIVARGRVAVGKL